MVILSPTAFFAPNYKSTAYSVTATDPLGKTHSKRKAGRPEIALKRKQYWLELQFLSVPKKICLQTPYFYRTFFL